MATAFTIFTLLVFLSSLETTASRNTPFQDENSLRREQTGNGPGEEECILRRPDGTCHNQWRVGKKGKSELESLERRQANCDRRKSPNCRVMIGKKSREYFKRLNPKAPCDKRSEKCEKLYMYKTALKSEDLETKQMSQKCNLKSPTCYLNFPGKRKPKKEKDLGKRVDEGGLRFSMSPEARVEVDNQDSVTMTESDLLGELLVARGATKLPYELSGGGEQEMGVVPTVSNDSDNSKPTCDPKRDFQCRFRIFGGKREQIFNKPTYPKSYKYN